MSKTDLDRTRAKQSFRQSQRWLFILLALLFPLAIVAAKISDRLHSEVPFSIVLTALTAMFIFICGWSFVAYCRWTGKYPFYWLFRK